MPIVVSVSGRLTKDMEVKDLDSGTKLCLFTIASNRTYKDRDGEYGTDFISVKCFVPPDKTGQIDNRQPVLVKGQQVWLTGQEMSIEEWEDSEGNMRRTQTVQIWSLYRVDYDPRSISKTTVEEPPPF